MSTRLWYNDCRMQWNTPCTKRSPGLFAMRHSIRLSEHKSVKSALTWDLLNTSKFSWNLDFFPKGKLFLLKLSTSWKIGNFWTPGSLCLVFLKCGIFVHFKIHGNIKIHGTHLRRFCATQTSTTQYSKEASRKLPRPDGHEHLA
jgi:hypothetical protein